MSLDPNTGRLLWQPSEDAAPGNYRISVKATDNGIPNLSATHEYAFHLLEREADLVVLDIAISGSQIRLSWAATAGELYRVEQKASWTSAWTPVPGDLSGSGETLAVTYPSDGAIHRFYRVRLVR